MTHLFIPSFFKNSANQIIQSNDIDMSEEGQLEIISIHDNLSSQIDNEDFPEIK